MFIAYIKWQTLQLSRLRRDSHDFGLNLKLTRLSLKISRLKFLTHFLALHAGGAFPVTR